MRMILLAFALMFAGFVPAHAQMYPRLLEGKDVFKMEDEAAERWKAALPRLAKSGGDYWVAWNRMSVRLDAGRQKWLAFDVSDIERKKEEMWQWCLSLSYKLAPNLSDASAAEQFARLEVRAKLCEETPVPVKGVAKK